MKASQLRSEVSSEGKQHNWWWHVFVPGRDTHLVCYNWTVAIGMLHDAVSNIVTHDGQLAVAARRLSFKPSE